MSSKHFYTTKLSWTGNTGKGTSDYRSYLRSYEIQSAGKPLIEGSSDPAFRGDPLKYNPEDLFLASIASCHMLWYLHLCAVNGVVVESYEDQPEAIMEEQEDGSGHFTEVLLKIVVVIRKQSNMHLAKALHEQANQKCFIANSVRVAIKHEVDIHTVD